MVCFLVFFGILFCCVRNYLLLYITVTTPQNKGKLKIYIKAHYIHKTSLNEKEKTKNTPLNEMFEHDGPKKGVSLSW